MKTEDYYLKLNNELSEGGFKLLYKAVSDRSDRVHVIIDTVDLELDPIVKPFVRNNELILSIGPKACGDLTVKDGRVSFTVMFSGVAKYIAVDIDRITAVSDGYNTLYLMQRFEILIPGTQIPEPEPVAKRRKFTVINGGLN